MASSRRKQDEKHLKILRELGSQTSNRTCFDCHQRGTTYINMTVGSFVCTSCSGILRGLNPPHRVKSISMASFTPEEIEQIKSKGNQYCQAVWLGLYDAKANPFPDTKDEHKIRDFMISKYEKKRFYIDPVVALKNMPPQTSSATSSNASTPSGESTGSKTAPTANSSVSRPNVPTSQSTGSSTGSASKTSTPKSSASLDLLADLGNQSSSSVNSNDPFASPTSTQAPTSISQPSFANFENANIFTNTAKDQPSQIQIPSSCTSQSQPTPQPSPPTVILYPDSSPSTGSPSPSHSPNRFNRWEAFDGEEATAVTPLIPSVEALSSSIGRDVGGKPIGKGKNNPSMIFAAGVSAQFVCPTNPNFAACARAEGKLLSNPTASFYSSSAPCRVSMIDCAAKERESDLSSGLHKTIDSEKIPTQSVEASSSENVDQSSVKKVVPKIDDKFSYSSLKINSSDTETPISEKKDSAEGANGNYIPLNVKSNEISSKCFAAFLSSTSKLGGKSYLNFGSRRIKRSSCSESKVGQFNENLSVEIGQIALELENAEKKNEAKATESLPIQIPIQPEINFTESLPIQIPNQSEMKFPESFPIQIPNQSEMKFPESLPIQIPNQSEMKFPESLPIQIPNQSETKFPESLPIQIPNQVGSAVSSCFSSVAEAKTNPFLSSSDCKSMSPERNSIFDKVPPFNKRRFESSKPICIINSVRDTSSFSSSCPPSTFAGNASYTNPFVPVSQPATNTFPDVAEADSSSRTMGQQHQSFGSLSSSATDVFMHDDLQKIVPPYQHDTYKSMTPATYILAGATSSNKSTPSGPPPPFSNSPLTPMAPGSSSSSSIPNSSSANHATQASNQPLQDRYAALKDLDEEFKTHKETDTITPNGGSSWAIPNGSQHSSTNVFNGGGSVFGSPGSSSNVFSSGLVNGGTSGSVGGGVFGTPPNNSGSNNTWANFPGANPFSGSSNGTGSPWVNGGNAFGSPNQTQQGFGSVVQPNPFGTTPDPNFNQFGNSAPINGTSPNTGAWANFNQQQQQTTKMQWMASNGSANPFMATPQMPSSGASYNPFL